MNKLLLLVVLALAIPAAAIADTTTPTTPAAQAAAQAACRAQRTSIGAAAFKALYAPSANANQANAFGKCVSAAVKNAQANTTAAIGSCKTEQSDPNFATGHGGKTFAQFYGTHKNGSDAFGKCVAAKAAAANQARQAAIVAAAKSCKTEQAADRGAFKTHYGTNADKSNAFGKCVSTKVAAAKSTP
jgi:hypothetical protein